MHTTTGLPTVQRYNFEIKKYKLGYLKSHKVNTMVKGQQQFQLHAKHSYPNFFFNAANILGK